jgi:hypothetical protein
MIAGAPLSPDLKSKLQQVEDQVQLAIQEFPARIAAIRLGARPEL